jgi:hypothetical protein
MGEGKSKNIVDRNCLFVILSDKPTIIWRDHGQAVVFCEGEEPTMESTVVSKFGTIEPWH